MCQEVELLKMQVYKNTKLPAPTRHAALLYILNLPSYYKPKLQLSHQLLQEVTALYPES